jgi:acyl-coenzyme A thioesterase PaaI-like protein
MPLGTRITMVDASNFCPVSNETVLDVYEHVFAPWVKDLGLTKLAVSRGQASARLPANPKLNFSSGAACGQVIMAAVDTVVSLAMLTTDRSPKGTVYQHTHFLRAAVNDDFLIEANVLRFGKSTAYAEATVTVAVSGELVARASAEFAF